jgi:Flp pilus assembly protein TadG
MSQPVRIAELAGNERGAVLVMFAVFAPVAILLAAFALDTGNWFLHKRHLQLQADAGALAAAQMFQPCSNTAIKAEVEQYSGVAGSSYNAQIGGTSSSNIHELVNSKIFYNQPSSPKPDDTVQAEPCSPTAQMVDVKLTETNLPWYWRLFSSVPYIDAHARVAIRKLSEATGSFPVAVNDLRPKAVEAYFVDESVSPATQLMTCGSSGSSPCSVALKSGPTSNGLSVWNNIETPFPFAVRKPNVGVRVAVSGRSTLTGNMTTDCSQTLVTCSDASSAAVGLLHIQGYTGNGTGTTTVPIARKVQLSGAPGGCTDGYFSNPSTSCALAVSAEVNWGTATRPTGADVDAVVGGICYALTFKSTSGTNELWSSEATAPASSCSNFAKAKEKAGTGYVPLAQGVGAIQINLQAKDSSAIKTFSAVQRTYAASTNSEPVQEALLGREGHFTRDEDSFRMCESGNEGAACTPSLIITLGLSGSLSDAQAISDPIYTMRFSGTGSQNQSVSCTAGNGGSTYADALASGCKGTWAINTTLTCPDTTNPVDCITPATGNKENQVAKGMNLRVLGNEKPKACTNRNHWKEFTFTNGVPNVSTTDPRVVTAFVTPYGSFGGSGSSSSFPITEFATFYVTGWQDKGNGFNNPCQGNGDDTAEPGTIVGHFIKYTTLDTSGTGTEKCEPNALGQCVAVLTR